MAQNEYEGWQSVLTLFQEAVQADKLNEVLGYMLTDEERKQLATRALLTNALLEKEESQRDIAKRLKISIAKITRGSNLIKIMTPDAKQFLSNHLKPK
jgi:TrpR family trp operon transcriptional repressor